MNSGFQESSPQPEERLRALADARIWVSGAQGFIGTHLVHQLKKLGAKVSSFEGDIRKPGEVEASIIKARPSHLFHLAAPVRVDRDPSLIRIMQDTIVGGSMAVLDACDQLSEPPVLVHCGTCEEYGNIPAPFAETDEPSAPVSPYAAAKLQATRQILERSQTSSVQVAVARPFLTFGPGQRPTQLVPAAIQAALKNRPFPMTQGSQTRELNYVEDTVRGLALASVTPAIWGSIINIGGGEELAVRKIAERIFGLAGADPKLLQLGALEERSGEVPRFFADTSRCRTVLGHQPSLSLDEGLSRTIEWARQSSWGPEVGQNE